MLRLWLSEARRPIRPPSQERPGRNWPALESPRSGATRKCRLWRTCPLDNGGGIYGGIKIPGKSVGNRRPYRRNKFSHQRRNQIRNRSFGGLHLLLRRPFDKWRRLEVHWSEEHIHVGRIDRSLAGERDLVQCLFPGHLVFWSGDAGLRLPVWMLNPPLCPRDLGGFAHAIAYRRRHVSLDESLTLGGGLNCYYTGTDRKQHGEHNYTNPSAAHRIALFISYAQHPGFLCPKIRVQIG